MLKSSKNKVAVEDLEKKEVSDASLRPVSFGEYIGQENVKSNLDIAIRAAKKREEPIEHVLLYGPPGLGKTTLAHIIAKELGVNMRVTSGPAIERVGDLASILTNLAENDVLFIDEIHRLNKTVEEILYPAMEDFALDLVLGKGPAAKIVRLDIPRCTIIGATTRIGMVSSPLRSRFGMNHRLEFYEEKDIADILMRSARIIDVKIAEDAAKLLARSSRRTPRLANRLLKRTRDFADVNNFPGVDVDVVKQTLESLNIDNLGLDDSDRKVLETIMDKFNGGPVGLSTIAASTAEEVGTVEEVIEPYLMQVGFLKRTPRGREVTSAAYKHLGKKPINKLEI